MKRFYLAIKGRIIFTGFILINFLLMFLTWLSGMLDVNFGVENYQDIVNKMSMKMSVLKNEKLDFDKIRAGFDKALLDKNISRIEKSYYERTMSVLYATEIMTVRSTLYLIGDEFNTYHVDFEKVADLIMSSKLSAKCPALTN